METLTKRNKKYEEYIDGLKSIPLPKKKK